MERPIVRMDTQRFSGVKCLRPLGSTLRQQVQRPCDLSDWESRVRRPRTGDYSITAVPPPAEADRLKTASSGITASVAMSKSL
jgi:hypothetical protein